MPLPWPHFTLLVLEISGSGLGVKIAAESKVVFLFANILYRALMPGFRKNINLFILRKVL